MRRVAVSRSWSILAILLLAVAALVPLTEGVRSPSANADPPPKPTATHAVTIDGQDPGRTFDGVGGVSAGGSSRLLVDYPQAERTQILDYLFAPNYGAALDILKVEIGGDVDATVGAEPSHERVKGTVQCDRGYEWWLMEQARQRNPDITFYGVPWGAPGWFEGGYWSQDRVDYLISWLDCAKQNGFEIDYLGAANESQYDRDVSVRLAEALDANGYGDVQVVATDNHHPPDYWFVAPELQNDQAFNDAVDILGEHDVCVWRTLQRKCHVSDAALDLGKPLWDSENSTQDYQIGHHPLARAMNRHYIDGRITGNLNWALVSSWYDNFPIGGTGLMIADRPWSGHYEVGPSIWVDAHTTQFTDPGWQYLNGSSDYSAAGASYVSLRSPDTGDYSTVIETLDSEEAETFEFEVTGGLSNAPVQVWSTNLRTKRTGDDFEHQGSIQPNNGTFSFPTEPGHLYTLSTTTDASKGTAKSAAGAGEQLAVPYAENFENVGTDRLARYLSDVHGGFEAAPCAGDRDGSCYRQVITTEPLAWHSHGTPPTTIVGDPRWWGDYEVGADVLLEQAGTVELLGRVDSQQHNAAGYHLSLSDTGDWELYSQNNAGNDRSLASGTTTAPGVGSWHRLTLRFEGDQVTALLDGTELGTVQDDEHTTGQVGLRVGGWKNAQFDNVKVERTAAAPTFVPHAQLTATATSEHAANDAGHVYTTDLGIDDRLWSSWKSEYSPLAPLPQSMTLELRKARTLRGLTYTPPVTAGSTGAVTAYNVYASEDGEQFTKVGSGNWKPNGGTKTAPFDQPVTAKAVRLEATDVNGCPRAAAVTELNVSTSALQPLGHGVPPDDPLPDFPNIVPKEQLSASATSQQADFEAGKAIDGDCGTMWHQSFNPYEAPPQSITLDLGQAYDTTALIYQPRQDGQRNGIVTTYDIAVSSDGQSFTSVANGNWAADDSIKYDEWTATGARYVRLTANEGFNGHVSAAELDVAYAN